MGVRLDSSEETQKQNSGNGDEVPQESRRCDKIEQSLECRHQKKAGG